MLGENRKRTVCLLSLSWMSLWKAITYRVRGWDVFFYFHEPFAWQERIADLPTRQRITSLLEHGYLWCLHEFVTRYLVDNENAAYRAMRFQLRRRRKVPIAIAPLLFPLDRSTLIAAPAGRKTVALIGRIDKRRRFSDFERAAEGHGQLVLTSTELPPPVPPSVVASGRPFAEVEKTEVFRQAHVIYGVFVFRYNQSGANKEALCRYKPVIVASTDPMALVIKLSRLGLVVETLSTVATQLQQISLTVTQIAAAVDAMRQEDLRSWKTALR